MLAHYRAYKRAYSDNWQGIFVPFLRRGLYCKAAARLASAAPPNATILDIGTGPGHLLASLADLLPNAALHGIDTSPHMTDEAHRLIKAAGRSDQITLQQADAAALPFEPATFDCVISMMSLSCPRSDPGAVRTPTRAGSCGSVTPWEVGGSASSPEARRAQPRVRCDR